MTRVATSAPTPPAAPQSNGQGLGDALSKTINDAVAGALAGTRTELGKEITRLELRHEALTAELNNAPPAARPGLERRIEETDRDLAKVRSAMDKLERRLSTRDGPQTFAGTGTPPQFPNSDMGLPFNPAPMVIAIVSIIFIGFPIALTMSRYIWKRSTNAPAPPLSVEQTRRFDRLEQSVDAIAIEVERISENQRYLTKLLAEPKQSAKIGS
jgi:hypothetical protein